MPGTVTLRPSSDADATWIAELRAVVMRPDLERLGRFDPVWVRERFLRAFVPANTRLIEVDGETAGSIAVRPEPAGHAEPREYWLEHFYIDDAHRGRGLGTGVLRRVLAELADGRPVRLNVLQGSPARRLYERHGFVFEREDEVDVWLVRE